MCFLARASRWMNTSSRRGSTGRQSRPSAMLGDRLLQQRAVGAGDVERAAEDRRRLDAGRLAEPPCRAVDVGTRRLEGHEPGMARDLVGRPFGDDAAAREIDDALAALGLVHVMRRDQRGEAFPGHVVDQVPELAPRLGVDARGRLVEQQQPRLMQHASGQRQALLPAARELPRELPRARPQRHPRDDRVHRAHPVLHLVDASDEVEILGDGQVLIEAEALRHVADIAADRRRFAADVEADAGAAAAIGRQAGHRAYEASSSCRCHWRPKSRRPRPPRPRG